jgi:hypothetical protein
MRFTHFIVQIISHRFLFWNRNAANESASFTQSFLLTRCAAKSGILVRVEKLKAASAIAKIVWVVRRKLRESVPKVSPTHRNDLFADEA